MEALHATSSPKKAQSAQSYKRGFLENNNQKVRVQSLDSQQVAEAEQVDLLLLDAVRAKLAVLD